MMNCKNLPFKLFLIASIVASAFVAFGTSYSLDDPYEITRVLASTSRDTVPLRDRQDDFINDQGNNPFDLKDPSIIKQEVEYDPETGYYIIREKIGDEYFRMPTYMTFQEYLDWKAKQDQQDYFDQISDYSGGGKNDPLKKFGIEKSASGIVDPIANIDLKSNLVDRLFGGTKVDIRPQGNIDLTFGWRYSRSDNPGWTIRQQRVSAFDFDMNINMSVQGKIGEKLNLNFNYNSKPTFDFDNQMKLNYDPTKFSEDDIIQNIEAGNVSLPLKGSLIQGAQSLFGLRLDTKWGPLRLSTLIAQQKSDRENIQVQGGAQYQDFEVFADQYDENRHFFISHYNRSAFEESLSELPIIRNVFQIEKIQVFLTDDRNVNREDVVDIVALADLGEPERIVNPGTQPSAMQAFDYQNRPLPANRSNDLYQRLTRDSFVRKIENAVFTLQAPPFRLQQGRDFEKVSAQILREGQHYTVHKELGYISLNVNVQPDQVVGVSYQYSYNGEVYQVGEFANDVPNLEQSYQSRNNPDPTPVDTTRRSQTVVFTKMLKSATQRIDLPMWDLMMKNVYNIGAYNVNREDFLLDIYYDEPGGGERRFLNEPTERNVNKVPLLRFFNLDNLNVQGDPFPDGVFDYVVGLTINPRNGRIMFPVLEPFGSSLTKKFTNANIAEKYSYQVLYDSTVTRAREYPDKNRFVIRGTYKTATSNEISLNAFNIPRGSLRVTAGGQLLQEGRDYEVDYGLGKVRVLNDAYITSGVPINVSFEDNSLFGFQQKNLIGIRADYDVSKNLIVGATYMHLFERPFTQKVNIGDDPINNRVFGLDMAWGKELPWLTKWVDRIPFLETKAPSSFSFTAEAAAVKPGHSRAINEAADKDKGGVVYIDDFEGSVSGYTLSTPVQQWVMASVPQNDGENNNPLFPEANIQGTLSGVNRALLNWYQVEERARIGNPRSPYTDLVDIREIFKNTERQTFQNLVRPLDISYYPDERGPYNFDLPGGTPYSKGLDFFGKLNEPKTRWAGIMRDLPNNDFEAANIEFIEFWMLSPFLNDSLDRIFESLDPFSASQREGSIYINLGNISEDLLKDSRLAYENGLPGPAGSLSENRQTDVTSWGRVPRTKPITNAFDNESNSRTAQDVGFDGLDDDGEREHFQAYLDKLTANINPPILAEMQADPANDNFRFFLDPEIPGGTSVRDRYKKFNNPQGNSRPNDGNQTVQSAQLTPDTEDLNDDKTLNESEAYFQYKIPVEFDGDRGIKFSPFVTDSVQAPNGRLWYRFKIPIDQYEKRVGGIQDFRSVRFIRMYLRDFEGPVTMRFAEMNLGRNQWRRYARPIKDAGPNFPDLYPETLFDVNDVNIEENTTRQPFGYVLPEGIRREQSVGGFQPNLLQNEQSLALTLRNLNDGNSKAIYKLVNLDMRVFKKLKMFVHAETDEIGAKDGDLHVFMRIGSDFEKNYYEYEIPLTYSKNPNLPPASLELSREVWRPENEFDFALELLKKAKINRNNLNYSFNEPYQEIDSTMLLEHPEYPARFVRVVGNPDLGRVKGIMIGIRNPLNDGVPHNTVVWVNELRVNGLDERGGVAAVARMDVTLADFGQLTAASNYSSIGYGNIDQKLAQRSQEDIIQYDLSANLQLGKFFPEDFGLRVPFLAQYSNNVKVPRFEPITRDLELKEVLDNTDNQQVRDSIYDQAITRTEIKSFNFNNVRKERKGADKLPLPWDIENFTVSYSFTETNKQTPFIENDNLKNYTGNLDYQYALKPLNIQPLKGLVKKDKYLKLFTEFNFNPFPSNFSFSTDMTRNRQVTKYRFAGDEPQFNTFFNKQFLWDRDYNLTWDLSKSLKFVFNATNQSVIDELSDLDEEGNYRPRSVLKENNWQKIKELGRTKNYQHNFSFNYTLPFKLIPYMDWINVRAQYNGTYNWSAAALNVEELGNVIQNTQKRDINADLKFDNLYNKWPYLKKINTAKPPSKAGAKKPKDDKQPAKPEDGKTNPDGKTAPAPKSKDKKKNLEPSDFERAILRPLMLVRSVRLRYNEDYQTIVPGFLPQSKLLGLEKGFGAPGWDFAAGLQPDNQWFDKAADRTNNFANPWITTDFFLNQKVQQNYTQTLEGKLSMEPFSDFRIEVDMKRRYTENHSELFKDRTNDGVNNLERLLPQDVGQLDITYYSAKTLFKKDDFGVGLFSQFQENRKVISQRIGTPGTQHSEDFPEYTRGYGPTQMDVLIPSFVAAYSGSDANSTKLDIFKTVPRPNWTVNYNGLSKLPMFKELFSSISIRHGYKSSLVVTQYNTNLNHNFEDPFGTANLNPETQSYYSRLEIPNVIIREGFSPLLGIDIRTKNNISMNFGMDKTRELRMDFFSYQLSENKATNYKFSFGYLMQNVKVGFLQPKKSKKKKEEAEKAAPNQPKVPGFGGGRGGAGNPQDLNINFDFSLQDQITINHLLDINQQDPTRGQLQMRISPSADYQFNRRLNFRAFVEYTRNVPKTSQTPPRTEIFGGVTVSFTLN